ncbi:MAG: hypothetical protein JWQ27_2407 [Ferruginibacter sp.]|nr:hypothetical protein [Ferruginibacter sp.]
MAQKVEFTREGLNLVAFGESFSNAGQAFKPLKSHHNSKDIRVWFEKDFDYFYLDSDTLFIERVGIVNALFIAVDKLDKVAGIFLVIEPPALAVVESLNIVYGESTLQSNLSIDNNDLGKKYFWFASQMSISINRRSGSELLIVSYSSSSMEDSKAGINMY